MRRISFSPCSFAFSSPLAPAIIEEFFVNPDYTVDDAHESTGSRYVDS
jgi:hypothetical protein